MSRVLKRLIGRDTSEIRLTEVARSELSGAEGGPAADAELARRLGALVNVRFIQTHREYAEREDSETLASLLTTVKLLASSGRWQLAGELLIPDEGKEYAVEAALRRVRPGGERAPRQLRRIGTRLRTCVPTRPAHERRWSGWPLGPGRPTSQIAARSWTTSWCSFESSSGLAAQLRGEIIETQRGGMDRDADGRLAVPPTPRPVDPRAAPGRSRDPRTRGSEIESALSAAATADEPRKDPRCSSRTGVQRCGEMIDWYERSSYPLGVRPTWSTDGPGEDVGSRRDWLTLLMLGAMHTMGWYGRSRHKAFLEECERRRWLEPFAELPRDPRNLVDVLDQYLEDKVRGT